MLSTLLPTLAGVLALASTISALADGLSLVYSVELPTQGIAISSDGRKFLSQRYSTTLPPIIVELLDDNTTVPYPDVAWNSWNSSVNVSTAFVSIDGARIGPDGRYWAADAGTTDANGTLVPNSAKLVGINLTTNAVDRIYFLSLGPDDVRFNPFSNTAYLSITTGALLVLNLTSGAQVTVLSQDPSAVAHYPMSYNHTFVPGYGTQTTLSVGLDQIEVSPDGQYLYYQPCNGGLYRLETELVDASLTNATLAAELGEYAEPFASTPSTGGSTIDADGNVYVSDTNSLAIWKITPEGVSSVLVQDDALLWTDLMWVDAQKNLWLPASQMRPGGDGLMHNGTGPNNIFTFPIDAGPSPIDHA